MNATAHGLRAVNPVQPGEDANQWEVFRTGVVADLGAVGTLETELAERVAGLMWRLRRVPTFEVSAASSPPAPPPSDFRDVRNEEELKALLQESPKDIRRHLAHSERGYANAVRAADILD